jgi:large subunit ribosomal protein L15
MKLNDVHRGIQKNKKRRRIGRGPGSGHGKTAGHGHKGQQSRAGWSIHPIFQGGAMPLVRRIPKRGFNNKFALQVAIVNTGDLDKLFADGEEVTPESLCEKSIIKRRYDVLKVLGEGTLSKKLKISAHRFSKSAVQQIVKAGGQAIVLAGRTSVEEKKQQKKAAAKA